MGGGASKEELQQFGLFDAIENPTTPDGMEALGQGTTTCVCDTSHKFYRINMLTTSLIDIAQSLPRLILS